MDVSRFTLDRCGARLHSIHLPTDSIYRRTHGMHSTGHCSALRHPDFNRVSTRWTRLLDLRWDKFLRVSRVAFLNRERCPV